VVSEGEGAVSSVCVDGASYDLTVIDDRRAVHLRRSCDRRDRLGGPRDPGAGGRRARTDPRFDVVFAEQPLARYAQSYASSARSGGPLRR
jgi:hypothetical protein